MIDTINTITKMIVNETNESEPLVKKVYAHYWASVKEAIASGKHTSIWLRNIGTFTVSRHKVNMLIKKMIIRVRKIKTTNTTFMRKTKDQMLLETINDLKILCSLRNEIAKIYLLNIKSNETKS